MGMDIDWVFLDKALDNVRHIASCIPHGEREKIADDILKFEKKICKKYNGESAFTEKK